MADEMYTTRQAAIYLGVTEADIRLAIREGKLRAWTLPVGRGLIVRKSELLRYRSAEGRSSLTRQLQLFAADAKQAPHQPSEAGSKIA